MAFVPLRLAPGVFRQGTRYMAKGRWHDTQLVRWHDGAMQPWGGWTEVLVDRTAVDAAISDDGGVQTDETADANSAAANDVVLVPTSPAVNDAFYLGDAYQFEGVEVDVGTAATDGAVTWEYFDGTAWQALAGVIDNTSSFTVAGVGVVSWTRPTDWATTTVNAQGPFYYVRARVTTAGTTQALGDQCWIGLTPIRIEEPPRGSVAWRDNSGRARFAFGTATKAWTYYEGILVDITPAGFTTGGEDAVLGSGFGAGAFGAGPFGVGAGGSFTTVVEANTWQFDSFGQLLVGVAFSDGKLYSWDLNDANDLALVDASAPTGCTGLVVTPERFLFALGAGGDARTVQWPDQESLTDWTASATNQAGDFILDGSGQLLAGKAGRGETVLWTDDDVWVAQYIGGVLVYAFRRVGADSGARSRHAMAGLGASFYWMGQKSFYAYAGGAVRSLPNEVSDYVFSDLNETQASKIFALALGAFQTIVWFYPSAASTEVDRYVAFNAKGGHWEIGKLERTAGVGTGTLDFPVLFDSDGVAYDHERGTSYLDPAGAALTPSAESGPVELGEGDAVYDVVYLVPDDATVGDVSAEFLTAFFPDEAEVTRGPFTLSKQTSVRFAGRQVRLKLSQVQPDWRVGVPRLDVRAAGRR